MIFENKILNCQGEYINIIVLMNLLKLLWILVIKLVFFRKSNIIIVLINISYRYNFEIINTENYFFMCIIYGIKIKI